jgi:hypothetical protein
MKTRPLIPVCVVLALTSLSAREFTDTQGRKLDAEIVSVTGDTVALLRAGEKRPIGAKIALFSEGDQKFIREWAAANIKYSFDVAYSKKKLDVAKQRSGPETFITERWAYKIDLKNRVATELNDLRVDYWIFTKADDGKGKGTARLQTSGTTKIASVKGSSATTFETEPVEINKTQLDGGWVYADGTNPRFADGMGGLVVRVFDKNDREVYKFATKDDLLAAAAGRPKSGGSNSERSTSTPK